MPRRFLNGIDAANQRVTAVASPTTGTDAANKQYVDNLVAGLSYKDEVRVATTTTGTLTTAFANGSVVDGVTLATGDRILVKDQTTQTENGIYVVAASGAPTRATDADSTAELNRATVMVLEGTVNAGREYTQSTVNPTIGTNNIVFVQKTTGTTYTADGNGIEIAGSTFSIELDGTTLSKSAAGLRIGSGAAGNGLVEASGVLSVGSGTGISVTADAIAVDTSVVVRKFASSVGNASATTFTVNHNLGTRDVQVTVMDNTSFEEVYPDVVHTDANNVAVNFASAPASNAYRVIVQG